MSVVRVENFPGEGRNLERESCRVLEEGNILLFRDTPFELSDEDRAFLLERRQAEAGYHKNIAYRPQSDRVTGVARGRVEDEAKLRRVLRDYSRRVVRFAAGILPAYAARWRVDYASFRPQEEAGRKLSAHARNDLLHVDSFPTRPTGGDRILRIFTNINPAEPRVWRTGEEFEELAERFAVSSGLLARVFRPTFGRRVLRAARSAGLPVRERPPYDEFMHDFHNFLKENGEYQKTARAEQISFPPESTWIVFTDMVTHAVLSGQFALEQTFLVSRDTLALPAKAPISILERLSGRAMA
jgi:AraC-like DNA-binding protein